MLLSIYIEMVYLSVGHPDAYDYKMPNMLSVSAYILKKSSMLSVKTPTCMKYNSKDDILHGFIQK